MTTTREAGQSLASAQALDTFFRAGEASSDARSIVRDLQRQLREARKAVKLAETAERNAEQAYLETPWAEAS